VPHNLHVLSQLVAGLVVIVNDAPGLSREASVVVDQFRVLVLPEYGEADLFSIERVDARRVVVRGHDAVFRFSVVNGSRSIMIDSSWVTKSRGTF
jgi:hypothetical protein